MSSFFSLWGNNEGVKMKEEKYKLINMEIDDLNN